MGLEAGKQSDFTYYATGEVKTQTNANGDNVTSYYDDYSRVTSSTNPDGTDTFEYDIAQNGIGKLSKAESTGFTNTVTIYHYDFLSRSKKTEQIILGKKIHNSSELR